MMHYVEFKGDAGELSPGDLAHLLSRLVDAVHRINRSLSPDQRLTLAFPRARSGKSAFIGDVVRVFGKEARLREFVASVPVRQICVPGGLTQKRIRPVPDHHEWEIFSRDRREQKATFGFLLRSERRFIRKFQERHGRMPSDAELEQRRNSIRREESGLPFVRLRSSSTGQRFSLFIRRQKCDRPQPGQPNVYGLASAAGCAVPSF